MDSLTQAVLGASIAGACAPPGQRRKALLAGALLGTLPDLDVFIDYGDAVANFTRHRGFSHSLIVLTPFSILLWLVLRRWWAPVRDSPARWFAAIALVLITHPLLDAHTAYGTQLWWPLDAPPVMWATLFIIDPLYTLLLLAGTLIAALRPLRPVASHALNVGLMLSTLYLGWSWAAKITVEHHAKTALTALGLEHRPRFSIPTFFNTVLWRVVVLTDDGYLEGYDSLLLDEDAMPFRHYRSDVATLEAASNVPAVARLRWFARDFVKAAVEDGYLLVTDLRMGQEPHYAFTHIAAEYGNPHWKAVPTALLPQDYPRSVLAETWRRMTGASR